MTEGIIKFPARTTDPDTDPSYQQVYYKGGVMYVRTAGGDVVPLNPGAECAFFAVNSAGASNVTGDGTDYTVPFPTEVFDLGGNFASNTFTAHADGVYMFRACVLITGLTSSHTGAVLWLEGTATAGGVDGYLAYCNPYACQNSNGYFLMAGATMMKLDADDTVTVILDVSNGTKVVDIHNDDDFVQFMGYRVA